jgi:hypothetical protein
MHMAFFDASKRLPHAVSIARKHTLRYCLLLFAACVLIVLPACQTSRSTKAKLIKNVEAYHRDLVFERYDIAAKNIKPAARTAWLDAILMQHIKFTEIEVLATEPCDSLEASDPEHKDHCMVVYSDVQWFEQGMPSVHASRMATTWEYDRDEKAWFITEQNQK